MKLYQDATLRLTPGGTLNSQALTLFRLALWKGGRELDKVTAVSGQPLLQKLLTCRQRQAGSGQPIGEGVYRLGDHDSVCGINWASGRVGDFSGSWGAGLGPLWVGIHEAEGYPLTTHDFGIHADWNESANPGTLGCIGIQGFEGPRDLGRLKKLATWFGLDKPQWLVVDHGLGTVPKPA